MLFVVKIIIYHVEHNKKLKNIRYFLIYKSIKYLC